MFIFILLLISVALLGLGIVLLVTDDHLDWRGLVGAACVAVGAILLIGSGIAWLSAYLSIVSNIEEFKASEQTVARARQGNGREIESAALVLTMAENNEWLAKTKYWNNTFWSDWMIPDAVNDLQPIK